MKHLERGRGLGGKYEGRWVRTTVLYGSERIMYDAHPSTYPTPDEPRLDNDPRGVPSLQ